MKKLDLSLYLITDNQMIGNRDFFETIRQAVAGGVTVVQLREKTASWDEIREKARQLKKILDPAGIPLLINDHVDIAREVGAAGVHFGKSDHDLKETRKLLGPDLIIGFSVESLPQFEKMDYELCDYVSASPVFSTPTKKTTHRAFGIGGLKTFRRICPLPLVAIGGVNRNNVSRLAQVGVDGISVVSSIMGSKDPKRSAAALRRAFDGVRGRRSFNE